MPFFVYILFSPVKDNFYIGFTSDLKNRITRHNQKSKGFTGNVNDWSIVYTETYSSKEEAVKRELQIKSWKSRKKIQELMSLKETLKSTCESIQPFNLLKSTLHELTSSVEVQSLVRGAGNIISVLISKNPIVATFQKLKNKLIIHLFRFVINQFSKKL